MKTYYTQEQEAGLKEIVHYVRDTLSNAKWNSTAPLKEYADISPESPLLLRFADHKFLDVPVTSLMLSEVLYLATERGWTIVGRALDNAAYQEFTDQTHDMVTKEMRGKTQELSDIAHNMNRPGETLLAAPIQMAHAFVPAFYLTRGANRAYVSWINEIHTKVDGSTENPTLWHNLLVERGIEKSPLTLSHVLFYNTGLRADMKNRLEVRRFWR